MHQCMHQCICSCYGPFWHSFTIVISASSIILLLYLLLMAVNLLLSLSLSFTFLPYLRPSSKLNFSHFSIHFALQVYESLRASGPNAIVAIVKMFLQRCRVSTRVSLCVSTSKLGHTGTLKVDLASWPTLKVGKFISKCHTCKSCTFTLLVLFISKCWKKCTGGRETWLLNFCKGLAAPCTKHWAVWVFEGSKVSRSICIFVICIPAVALIDPFALSLSLSLSLYLCAYVLRVQCCCLSFNSKVNFYVSLFLCSTVSLEDVLDLHLAYFFLPSHCLSLSLSLSRRLKLISLLRYSLLSYFENLTPLRRQFTEKYILSLTFFCVLFTLPTAFHTRHVRLNTAGVQFSYF